jgi:hypothetical protein
VWTYPNGIALPLHPTTPGQLKPTPLMPLLSDAVIFFCPIVLCTPNGQFFNCATIVFSERYNLARELEDKVMKNEHIPVYSMTPTETELL